MSQFTHKTLLGDLSDPTKYHEDIVLHDVDTDTLLRHLSSMILIRKAEEKLGDKVTDGTIKCPCHLGIGQEAIAVGLSEHLRTTDRVYGAHRSHSHFLAINADLVGLFAEVLGKIDGSSKGMGGSMHLIDKANGFMGSVPIVGATIPIATGAAMAAKMSGSGDIAVSYFGDGATEEGVFHESLNLAATHKYPVLYICENNLFSSHLHISLRQSADSTARYAKAHRIDHAVVDGNDVVSMNLVCRNAIARIRETNEPFFIEAVTYRWRGHVGPREDMDVGVKRKDDLGMWKRRDPVRRLENALIRERGVDQTTLDQVYVEIDRKIEDAWQVAENSAYPELERLMGLVYSAS